jgi:hypothetical protein
VSSSEWRHQRIAANESSFRAINERLAASLRQVRHLPEQLEFICECGNGACDARVSLTIAEYEAVRADALTFVVLPGHVFPEAERVVSGTDRFQVVRKTSDAGKAEATEG